MIDGYVVVTTYALNTKEHIEFAKKIWRIVSHNLIQSIHTCSVDGNMTIIVTVNKPDPNVLFNTEIVCDEIKTLKGLFDVKGIHVSEDIIQDNN